MKCSECGDDLVSQLTRWQAVKLAWAVMFRSRDPYAEYRPIWLQRRLDGIDIDMQQELDKLKQRCGDDETGSRIFQWKRQPIIDKYQAKKDQLKQESAQRSLINKRWEI